MTKQMTKTQQALLILLDAGCDHKEIARLFGITEAQLQELCPNGVENEDREFTAKRDERQSKVSIVTDVNPFRPDRCVLPFKFNGSRRDKFAKGKGRVMTYPKCTSRRANADTRQSCLTRMQLVQKAFRLT